MVAILEKSDAAQGFEQIIDFLSRSYIYHALTVNPHVYISCIKQFWNTAVVKRSGDVTRLQALVDKKRIVITKEVVREILQLDDAEGVICLPNDEIFAGLTRMGYEKPVGKGFSGVDTPLFENMLAVRAVDAEEEVQVPAQDDVVQEHVIEEIATEVVPPTPTSPSPSSPVIPSLPHHQSPCPPQPQAAEETANAAQQLEIIKLKVKVKKLERLNKVKSSNLRRLKKVCTSQRVESSEDVENVFNQGRISVDIETDEGIELEVDQEKSVEEDTEVQEAVEVVTTAKIITEVVTAAATQVAAASAHIPAAKPKVLKIAAAPAVSTRRRKGVIIRDLEEELHIDTPAETPTVKDKGNVILIKDPKPMKKKDQIEMDAEYAKKLHEELEKEHEEAYKQIDWNAAFDHVQAKETQYIKRYHGFKKKPQSESKVRKNMISYLKNTEGYKMEFFKGKTYDQILLIFQARKKLSEEAQEADDLRGRLEIVQDEDDDVFVEAITLAQKVLVVDYQDAIWRNQKSVHGLALVKRWKLLTLCGVHVIILSIVQLFLLVERRYPLSRFTLEQLVNVARLQVEEESEMSLELLRFTRQQLLEYQQG
nr:hypothetical protein [Tanacetum cinerariifolium]